MKLHLPDCYALALQPQRAHERASIGEQNQRSYKCLAKIQYQK